MARSSCLVMLGVSLLAAASAVTEDKNCGGLWTEMEGAKSFVAGYRCPRPEGSQDEILCCDPPKYNCCRAKRFYEIDQMTGIIISVTVVLACVLIVVVVIVCCFWEKCPFYMACRAEAKPDYIAHPDEIDGLSPMPTENAKNIKVYVPQHQGTNPNYV